jgi:hypothetical protein
MNHKSQHGIKPTLSALLLLAVFLHTFHAGAQDPQAAPAAAQPTFLEGLLQSIDNADASTGENRQILLTRKNANAPIRLLFAKAETLGIQREQNQWWVLPISDKTPHIDANTALWILPLDAASKDRSWDLELHGGSASATRTEQGITVLLDTDHVTAWQAEARPHSDPFRHRFSFDIPHGPELEDALAAFYWGTMLPSVVEKTMAAHFPYSSGYVLSTLNTNSYAGSYPAVDHEFQIKGRLAFGSELDLDIVKRMIALQFQLMHDDPEHLSRAPTSVQPDGRREYHIRRSSMNNRENAAMFPLTGNIEVVEECWHYYQARKDAAWLERNIGNLEDAAAWTIASIDQYGRVWSDVYYEDQVMKDGRETEAQAFAAYTFDLLAHMETALGRTEKSEHYTNLSKKIAAALIEPLPMGYWDPQNHRFIDWVDRNGQVHDHIHLLANTLPVLFGYATPAQATAVNSLVTQNDGEFERFPSFLSANIAAYNDSEIGNGGPYDLSAAGRYWYWDAAFRASEQQNDLLMNQLTTVAAEGAKNNYFMGERYDMDHVYYIDGKPSHGAEKYYEYPNVFSAVLISQLLGLTVPADADLSVAPHTRGSVELDIPEYALRYSCDDHGFALKNLAAKKRTFKVDLSAIADGTTHYHLTGSGVDRAVGTQSAVTLPANGEAHWIPER